MHKTRNQSTMVMTSSNKKSTMILDEDYDCRWDWVLTVMPGSESAAEHQFLLALWLHCYHLTVVWFRLLCVTLSRPHHAPPLPSNPITIISLDVYHPWKSTTTHCAVAFYHNYCASEIHTMRIRFHGCPDKTPQAWLLNRNWFSHSCGD